MHLTLAHIGPKSPEPWASLTREYLKRLQAFADTTDIAFKTEAALLEWLPRQKHAALLILLDSRGKELSSEQFAEFFRDHQQRSTRHLVFAIGPADGWSALALSFAAAKLSLGPMTLAHALARLVLAEQLYRAHTILAGHPYHSGH